jgi:hypothetical protein
MVTLNAFSCLVGTVQMVLQSMPLLANELPNLNSLI